MVGLATQDQLIEVGYRCYIAMRARISIYTELIPTGYARKKLYIVFELAYNAITFISMLDAIRVAIQFLLIFGETNFVKVLKIREIREIYGPRNKSALRYFLNLLFFSVKSFAMLYFTVLGIGF